MSVDECLNLGNGEILSQNETVSGMPTNLHAVLTKERVKVSRT